MKHVFLGVALGLGIAGTAMAAPVDGTWRTEPGDTGGYLHVEIAPCGEAICGTITKAFKEGGAPDTAYEHLGKRMIWDMNDNGGGSFSGGKIWAPDSDKTYKSKMSLDGGTLTVKGCVAGGLICRGQKWQRVN